MRMENHSGYKVFSYISGHVCAGAIHFGGVLTGKSTAAVRREHSEAVHHEFSSGETGICFRAAQHKPSGWIARYTGTAAYGHFGRPEFPWERTDQAKILRAAVI